MAGSQVGGKSSQRLEGGCSSHAEAVREWQQGLEGIRQAKRELRLPLPNSLGVIALFCRQYDIIKDNDSNNNPKEKGKGPEQSPQGRPVGTRQKKSPSINTIDV